MVPHVDRRFAERMRGLLTRRGISYRALAAQTHYGKSYLHDLAAGKKMPTLETAGRIDDARAADLGACRRKRSSGRARRRTATASS